MAQYIMRRALLMIPTLWIVVTMVFLLLRVMPGDITDTLFMDASPNPEQKERLRHELGLDRPVAIQYVQWLGKLAVLDFGFSLSRGTSVGELIKERLPNSLRLGAMSLVFAWIIAIPIGVLSAVKQDSWVDYVARGGAIFMLAVPNFFLAVLVLIVPAYAFGWAPPMVYPPFSQNPLEHLVGLLTPSLMVGIALTGTLLRMTRAMMLEVLRSDYIRTARAKGLAEKTIILRHGLKNALIPVVTILGTQLSLIVGGTVVIESIFGVPGMGSMMYQAIITKDLSVVQTVTVFLATFILTMNLIVDISYAALDPRIKY